MIVNSNTTPENTEIKSQPKTTEAMAPGLNEVKPTDVATSEADSKQNPDPPVKAKAVVDYFKSLYISKGREFDEDVLYKYAQRKDLKSFIRKFHVIGGFSDSMPTQEESDAIYNTWLDTSVVEKKIQPSTVCRNLQKTHKKVQVWSNLPLFRVGVLRWFHLEYYL